MLKLDELDLMLAKELELDARQRISALTKKLSITHETVKRRLQRLLDAEVITIGVRCLDMRLLGFQISVMLGINVSPGKADKVVECLKSHKSIVIIVLTTGRYDILASAVLRDRRELANFLYEDLARIPYLARAEEMLYLDGIKESWKYLNEDTYRYRKPTPHNLDELDLKLIKELELCPRESVMNLARKLGVNRMLAGRRLQVLLDTNVIRVVSIVEPSYIGLDVRVCIFMKVQLGKTMSIANSLVAERRVRHIYTTSGQFDLLLSAAFKDINELSGFLKNRLGKYPGVISHETLIQIEVVKNSPSIIGLGYPSD